MTMVIPAGEACPRRDFRHAERVRQAGAVELEAALVAGREQLLALFDGLERALGAKGLRIAHDPVLNLPLWELGHVGWFEEHWLSRNPELARGAAADPRATRPGSLRADADALYDSSHVPHARRWQLELPDPGATRDYIGRVRESTLALLRRSASSDVALYFFRLVLFHEDMHREAWHFMAQQLGIDLGPAMLARAPAQTQLRGEWQVPGAMRQLGSGGSGFAFDNELQAGEHFLEAFAIDRAPVSWREFLPFVAQGGYAQQSLWTRDGWAWRTRHQRRHPRHLRQAADGWEQQQFGRWHALVPEAPVVQVSAHEAEAWCRWAGRRLPTETEWETAALLAVAADEDFEWGEVWEWTSTRFAPYAGFAAHPYRDYSQPWFDGRPVLRGASFATTPHMKHPRYRNYFPADRDDVFAGFRSCAVGQRQIAVTDAVSAFRRSRGPNPHLPSEP